MVDVFTSIMQDVFTSNTRRVKQTAQSLSFPIEMVARYRLISWGSHQLKFLAKNCSCAKDDLDFGEGDQLAST